MISVAIATAGRPDHLDRCLTSLAGQGMDEIVVVDQSADASVRQAVERACYDRARHVHQASPGASLARNRAARLIASEYVVFLDDDAEVAPGWGDATRNALERHGWPDALFGAIRAPRDGQSRKGLSVSTFDPLAERVWTGMTHPAQLGYAGHFAVRRDVFEALGGFDARLGPGTVLHGAEDMDLNFRLLRRGFRAVTTPTVSMTHHQWRSPKDVPRLYRRYNLGHSAFCVKHLLAGDPYPLRLIAIQAVGDARMLASGLRRRSGLRVRTAFWRAVGTWQGLFEGWKVFRR